MKRILIVDDQPEIRELVRMTLEMEGHEVHEAPDGSTALQQLGRVAPDLLLLDVMMPGMDGLQVCRSVKQGGGRGGPRVLLLSARSQPADRQAGLNAGADGYLTKPFSPHQLLQLVGRLA